MKALLGRTGPDTVYECAGIPSTIQQSADLIRRGGTVAMVGLSGQPAEIRPATWLLREVTLVASLGYVADEFEQTMDLMLDGRLRTEPLRSSTVPLSEIDAAFARLHESGDEIKILVDPRG